MRRGGRHCRFKGERNGTLGPLALQIVSVSSRGQSVGIERQFTEQIIPSSVGSLPSGGILVPNLNAQLSALWLWFNDTQVFVPRRGTMVVADSGRKQLFQRCSVRGQEFHVEVGVTTTPATVGSTQRLCRMDSNVDFLESTNAVTQTRKTTRALRRVFSSPDCFF